MSAGDIALKSTEGGLGGAAAGAMIGSECCPGYGTIIGAAIGLVVGAVVGGIEGKVESDAKDDYEKKQKDAITNQETINTNQARRQSRQMYTQAMANPTSTSETMFTEASLQRQANSGFATTRDRGNPFTATETKATHNYGRPVA